MEENVRAFLRRENDNRILNLESKNGLFECLSQHIFNVKLKHFQKMFRTFMQNDKMHFKNIMQLLDNTGNVPIKQDEEKEKAFNRRLDKCYDGITNQCTDIQPHSKFLHVYVFAIATLIGRPFLILHEDEAGDLSWSYFPFLYSHTYDLVRNKPEYTTQRYITMFFSTDHCYMIDSSRCPYKEPESYGCIGVYEKRLKAIVVREDITKRCVDQMAKRIPLRLEQQEALPLDIMTKSMEMYCSQSPENGNIPVNLNSHRPKRNDFVTLLLRDRYLLNCLFKVGVDHKKGHRIWRSFAPDDGFLPLEFHDKLLQLENEILTLVKDTSGFVARCTEVTQELSERRGNVNKAVIGGSAVGIVGGVLAIVGLALTPVTFGASLGLTIAGASLGAAGSIAGGTARAVEGIKQNSSVNKITEIKNKITDQENNIVEHIRDIEQIIESHSIKKLDHDVEGPGMNRRGFLAIGSAFRSLHGSFAIAFAAIRLGSVGVTIAASVLGPLSLALDIGFLAEAAHDLRKGCNTGAGRILEQNAMAIDMKMKFFMCMLRGNIPNKRSIIID